MGELALTGGGERADAESHFSTALDVARRQGAPPMVQRAESGLERVRAVPD